MQAALYGQLAAEVLGRRAAGRADPESLTLAARLLELNPEVYTVWNYRRASSATHRHGCSQVQQRGGRPACAASRWQCSKAYLCRGRSP